MKKIFIIIVIIFLFITGCEYFTLMSHKEWLEKTGNDEVDVYVGGYYGGFYPCYWINGTRIDLPFYYNYGNENVVNSIFVSGDDVYCGGTYDNSINSNACYWKNRELIKVDVNDENNQSQIHSIAYKAGLVFSIGEEGIEHAIG